MMEDELIIELVILPVREMVALSPDADKLE
jgi:hypothetical protein